MQKTLLDNDEHLDRRKVQLYGQDSHLPFDLYEQNILSTTYYEIDNLQDILDNYKVLSDVKRPTRKMMSFLVSLAKKTNRKAMIEMNEMEKTYGADYKRVMGMKPSFLDKLTFKVVPKSMLYLHGMTLENFKHFTVPLFSAYEFDVVDQKGTRMPASYVYEHYSDNIIAKEDRQEHTKQRMEEIKTNISNRPFIMVCTLARAEHKLIVRYIQDGGKRVPVAPVISM